MIGRAHGAALDAVTRALWGAVATGQISDEDATRLAEAIEARRVLGRTAQAVAGRGFLPVRVAPPRKHQRPPERSVAIERRRRLAASGPMPPTLAARFSTGELAVLRIVADEWKAHQVCGLCLDAIAARAGVSRTTAQNAIRQAKRLGMVEVQERRRPGARSLPNLVRIIDREWLAWIKHHGFKALNATDKVVFRNGASDQIRRRQGERGGEFITTPAATCPTRTASVAGSAPQSAKRRSGRSQGRHH
jgi:hypothetical protein